MEEDDEKDYNMCKATPYEDMKTKTNNLCKKERVEK